MAAKYLHWLEKKAKWQQKEKSVNYVQTPKYILRLAVNPNTVILGV